MTGEILNLAVCFQYRDPANQDLITKAPIGDYVQSIGSKVCALVTQVNTQTNLIGVLGVRIQTLESKPPYSYTLPSLLPTGIANPFIPIILNQFVQLLEAQFVQERNAIGNTTQIFNTLAALPPSLGQEKSLGTTGGNLSSLLNFVPTVQTLSDFATNLSVMIFDLRSAVTNIKLNMPNSCDSVSVSLQTTYQFRNLKLFFTGTIPANLVNCSESGSIFKIEDTSGNRVNVNVDVKGNLNNVAGVNIDLTASPINPANDLTISSIMCFNDPDLGSVCQKYIETLVSNTSSCPTITLSAGVNSVSFSFLHAEGSLTYVIQLFDSTNSLIQSQTVSVSGPINVTGIFNFLQPNSNYKVRVQMVTGLDNTRNCAFTPVTTLTSVCPAPNGVSVQITT